MDSSSLSHLKMEKITCYFRFWQIPSHSKKMSFSVSFQSIKKKCQLLFAKKKILCLTACHYLPAMTSTLRPPPLLFVFLEIYRNFLSPLLSPNFLPSPPLLPRPFHPPPPTRTQRRADGREAAVVVGVVMLMTTSSLLDARMWRVGGPPFSSLGLLSLALSPFSLHKAIHNDSPSILVQYSVTLTRNDTYKLYLLAVEHRTPRG